jgi:hypothetical protein
LKLKLVSESASGHGLGFWVVHPACPQFLGAKCHVEAHLLFEISVRSIAG